MSDKDFNVRGDCMGYTVAIVGATGAVGHQMIKMLEISLFQNSNFWHRHVL